MAHREDRDQDAAAAIAAASVDLTVEDLTAHYVQQIQSSWAADRDELMRVGDLSQTQKTEIEGYQHQLSEAREMISISKDLRDSLEKVLSVDNSRVPHTKLLVSVRNLHSIFSSYVFDNVDVMIMIKSGQRWTLINSFNDKLHSFSNPFLDKSCAHPECVLDTNNRDWKRTDALLGRDGFDQLVAAILAGHAPFKAGKCVSIVENSHFILTLVTKSEDSSLYNSNNKNNSSINNSNNGSSQISALDSAIHEYESLKDMFHSLICTTMVCFVNYLEASRAVVDFKSQILQEAIAKELSLVYGNGYSSDVFLQSLYKILFLESPMKGDTLITTDIIVSNVQNYANIPEVFFTSSNTGETHIMKSISGASNRISSSNINAGGGGGNDSAVNDVAFLCSQLPVSEINATIISSLIQQAPKSSVIHVDNLSTRNSRKVHSESILSIPIVMCNCKTLLNTRCNCSCSAALVFTRDVKYDDHFYISEETNLCIQAVVKNCNSQLQEYLSKVPLFQKSNHLQNPEQTQNPKVNKGIPINSNFWFEDFLDKMGSSNWESHMSRHFLSTYSSSLASDKSSKVTSQHQGQSGAVDSHHSNFRRLFLSNVRAYFGFDYSIALVHRKSSNFSLIPSSSSLSELSSDDSVGCIVLLSDDNEAVVPASLVEGDLKAAIRACNRTGFPGSKTQQDKDKDKGLDLASSASTSASSSSSIANDDSSKNPDLQGSDPSHPDHDIYQEFIPSSNVRRSSLTASGLTSLAPLLVSRDSSFSYASSQAANRPAHTYTSNAKKYENLLKIPESFHDLMIMRMSIKSGANDSDYGDIVETDKDDFSIIIIGGKIGFSKAVQSINSIKHDFHDLFVTASRNMVLRRIFDLKKAYKALVLSKNLDERSLSLQTNAISKFEQKLKDVLAACSINNMSSGYEESRLLVLDSLVQILKVIYQEVSRQDARREKVLEYSNAPPNDSTLTFRNFVLAYFNKSSLNKTSASSDIPDPDQMFLLSEAGQWRKAVDRNDRNDANEYEYDSYGGGGRLANVSSKASKSRDVETDEQVEIVIHSQGLEVLAINFSISKTSNAERNLEVTPDIMRSLTTAFNDLIMTNPHVSSWFLASEPTSRHDGGDMTTDKALFDNRELVNAALFDSVNGYFVTQSTPAAPAMKASSRSSHADVVIGDKIFFGSQTFKIWKNFIERIGKTFAGNSNFRILSLVVVHGLHGYILVPKLALSAAHGKASKVGASSRGGTVDGGRIVGSPGFSPGGKRPPSYSNISDSSTSSEIITLPNKILSIMIEDMNKFKETGGQSEMTSHLVEYLKSHRSIPELSMFSRQDIGLLVREATDRSKRSLAGKFRSCNVRYFTLMFFTGHLNVMRNRFANPFSENIKNCWSYYELIRTSILSYFEPFSMVFQSITSNNSASLSSNINANTSTNLNNPNSNPYSNDGVEGTGARIEKDFLNRLSRVSADNMIYIKNKILESCYNGYHVSDNGTPSGLIEAHEDASEDRDGFSLKNSPLEAIISCWNFSSQSALASGSDKGGPAMSALNQDNSPLIDSSGSRGGGGSKALRSVRRFGDVQVLTGDSDHRLGLEGDRLEGAKEDSIVLPLHDAFSGNNIPLGNRITCTYDVLTYGEVARCFIHSDNTNDKNNEGWVNNEYFINGISEASNVIRIIIDFYGDVDASSNDSHGSQTATTPIYSYALFVFANSLVWHDASFKDNLINIVKVVAKLISFYYNHDNLAISALTSTHGKFESLLLASNSNIASLQETLSNSRDINTKLTEFIQNIEALCQKSSFTLINYDGKMEGNDNGFAINESNLKLLTVKISMLNIVFANILHGLSCNQKNMKSTLLSVITNAYERLSLVVDEFSNPNSSDSHDDNSTHFSVFMHKIVKAATEMSHYMSRRAVKSEDSFRPKEGRDVSLYTFDGSQEFASIQKRTLYSLDLFNKCTVLEEIVRVESQVTSKVDIRQVAGRMLANQRSQKSTNLGDVVEYHPILLYPSNAFLVGQAEGGGGGEITNLSHHKLLAVAEFKSAMSLSNGELQGQLRGLTKDLIRAVLTNNSQSPDDKYFWCIYKATEAIIDDLRSKASNLLTIVETLIPALQELLSKFFSADCCVFVKDASKNLVRGAPSMVSDDLSAKSESNSNSSANASSSGPTSRWNKIKSKITYITKDHEDLLSLPIDEFESKLLGSKSQTGGGGGSMGKADVSVLRTTRALGLKGETRRAAPLLVARRRIDLAANESPFELVFVVERNSSSGSYHSSFCGEDENHLLSFADSFYLLVKSLFNDVLVISLSKENISLRKEISDLDSSLRKEKSDLDSSLRKEIIELDCSLRKEIAELNSSLRKEKSDSNRTISDLLLKEKIFRGLSYYYSSMKDNNYAVASSDETSSLSSSSSSSSSSSPLAQLVADVFCSDVLEYGQASNAVIHRLSSRDLSASMSAEVVYRFNVSHGPSDPLTADLPSTSSSSSSWAGSRLIGRPVQVVHQLLDSLLLYISVSHYYGKVVTIDPNTIHGGNLQMLSHPSIECISENTIGIAIIPLSAAHNDVCMSGAISASSSSFSHDKSLLSIVLLFDDSTKWNDFQHNFFRISSDNQFPALVTSFISGIEGRMALASSLTSMSSDWVKSRNVVDLFDIICSAMLTWNSSIAAISVDASGSDSVDFIETKIRDVVTNIAAAFSQLQFSPNVGNFSSVPGGSATITDARLFWACKPSRGAAYHLRQAQQDYEWLTLASAGLCLQGPSATRPVQLNSVVKTTLSNILLDILFVDKNYGYYIDFEKSSLWMMVEIHNSSNNVGSDYSFLFQFAISNFDELFVDFGTGADSNNTNMISGLKVVATKCINDLKQITSIILYSNFKSYSSLLYTQQLTSVISQNNSKMRILSDIVSDLSSDKPLSSKSSEVDKERDRDRDKEREPKALPLAKLAKKVIRRLLNFPGVEAVSLSSKYSSISADKLSVGDINDNDFASKPNFQGMTDDEIFEYNTFNFCELAHRDDGAQSSSSSSSAARCDLSQLVKVEYRMQYNELGGSLTLYYSDSFGPINSSAKIASNFLGSGDLQALSHNISNNNNNNNKNAPSSLPPQDTSGRDADSSNRGVNLSAKGSGDSAFAQEVSLTLASNSRDKLEAIRKTGMLIENIIFEQISKSFLRKASEYKFGMSLKASLRSHLHYIGVQKTKEAELRMSMSELETQLSIGSDNNDKLLLEIDKIRAKSSQDQDAARDSLNHYKLLNSHLKQIVNEHKIEKAKLEVKLNSIVVENKESSKYLVESGKTEKRENEKLKSEIEKLKVLVKRTENKFKETQSQLEDKETILKSQKINLEATLQRLSTENLKLSSENNRLQTREAKLLETHDHGGNRVKGLLNDLEVHRRGAIALELQVDSLRKDNSSLSNENLKLLEKLSALSDQLNRDRLVSSSRLSDTQEVTQQLTNELLDLKVRLQIELDNNARIKARLNTLELEKKSLLDGWGDVMAGR